MPELNGIAVARELVQWRAARTVLLTVHDDAEYVLAALAAGVEGYVLKTQASDDLVRAIDDVLGGRLYLSPGVSRAVVDAWRGRRPAADALSERERDVLRLIAAGRSSKEVGVVLGISTKTVESHRARLMDKLRIRHVAGLVRYAVRQGLIDA